MNRWHDLVWLVVLVALVIGGVAAGRYQSTIAQAATIQVAKPKLEQRYDHVGPDDLQRVLDMRTEQGWELSAATVWEGTTEFYPYGHTLFFRRYRTR